LTQEPCSSTSGSRSRIHCQTGVTTVQTSYGALYFASVSHSERDCFLTIFQYIKLHLRGLRLCTVVSLHRMSPSFSFRYPFVGGLETRKHAFKERGRARPCLCKRSYPCQGAATNGVLFFQHGCNCRLSPAVTQATTSKCRTPPLLPVLLLESHCIFACG
jgi:hypothetical protein